MVYHDEPVCKQLCCWVLIHAPEWLANMYSLAAAKGPVQHMKPFRWFPKGIKKTHDGQAHPLSYMKDWRPHWEFLVSELLIIMRNMHPETTDHEPNKRHKPAGHHLSQGMMTRTTGTVQPDVISCSFCRDGVMCSVSMRIHVCHEWRLVQIVFWNDWFSDWMWCMWVFSVAKCKTWWIVAMFSDND